jgi:hypothetical protein
VRHVYTPDHTRRDIDHLVVSVCPFQSPTHQKCKLLLLKALDAASLRRWTYQSYVLDMHLNVTCRLTAVVLHAQANPCRWAAVRLRRTNKHTVSFPLAEGQDDQPGSLPTAAQELAIERYHDAGCAYHSGD